MTSNTTAPTTQNEDWGFWGTMQQHAPAAWPIALATIEAATGCEPEQVRAFLDSRHGRHFADQVRNGLYVGAVLESAIAQATTKWMGWSIQRQASKDYGIPKGLPYLTGFVIHCAIADEVV